ncbi:acyltransferase family protein [Shigella flexneri]
MKQKELWINQIKGLCICLVVIYHSVITFYPHLTTFQHPLSEVLSKCWIYFNLYLAPFRMPVFFFSGYLIRRYIDSVRGEIVSINASGASFGCWRFGAWCSGWR